MLSVGRFCALRIYGGHSCVFAFCAFASWRELNLFGTGLSRNLKLETRNSKLKIVIAAGGTGGHLFPGLAVAREFQARHGASVTFITSPKAVATRILESAGFPWETVAGRALKGQGLFSRLGTWWRLPRSIREARRRLQALAAPSGFGHGRLHRRAGGAGGLVPETAPGPARTERPARLHQPLAG